MSTSNAGTSGVSGDLSLSTGAATVGMSGHVSLGSGSSANGSGGSIAISVGSGDRSGGTFSVLAGDSSGESGGAASIIAGSSSTSGGGSLSLALGDGSTSGGALTIDGGDGSSAGPINLNGDSGKADDDEGGRQRRLSIAKREGARGGEGRPVEDFGDASVLRCGELSNQKHKESGRRCFSLGARCVDPDAAIWWVARAGGRQSTDQQSERMHPKTSPVRSKYNYKVRNSKVKAHSLFNSFLFLLLRKPGRC